MNNVKSIQRNLGGCFGRKNLMQNVHANKYNQIQMQPRVINKPYETSCYNNNFDFREEYA